VSEPKSARAKDKFAEAKMKGFLIAACMLLTSNGFAADAPNCHTNLRGQTICTNGEGAVVANPNTETVTTVQKNQNGVTTAQSTNGDRAAYNSNTGTATTTKKYENGATSAQNSNGARAAYNPNTGNAAVSQKNANGVTTTETTGGGEAKTKNGMGAVQGPNGTTCAKGLHNQGCDRDE
jgi:hypothetical protein